MIEETERVPLTRYVRGAWFAGVASGIARHLGWPVWLVRMCFLGLAITSFIGVVVYGALWILMAPDDTEPDAPGIAAATRANMRPARENPINIGRFVSVLLLVVGVLLVVQSLGLGISTNIFGPALIAGLGVTVIWLQSDLAEHPAWLADGAPAWLRALVSERGFASATRVVAGIALVAMAVASLATTQIGLRQLPMVLWVGALTVAGVVVVAAPWVARYRRDLDRARADKLVSETRADMAAHLHDSVLQTLSLIQRQPRDPQRVAALARRQERELREWLYDDPQPRHTMKAALDDIALEIDARHGVPIDVVTVGDVECGGDLDAMVQAAREAMTNAAKHSQAARIDVFAEVENGDEATRVEIDVRDRGIGFDPQLIGGDRMGVRRSIIERMQRHGGSATIRTAPGEGTEIRLEMTV